MKEFKYDVKLLIQGVRDRPCLWDKSLEVYKDRLERRTAWEEIFNILDESYETMPAEEKRLTGKNENSFCLCPFCDDTVLAFRAVRNVKWKPRSDFSIFVFIWFSWIRTPVNCSRKLVAF